MRKCSTRYIGGVRHIAEAEFRIVESDGATVHLCAECAADWLLDLQSGETVRVDKL
jgi:hypothetical protein